MNDMMTFLWEKGITVYPRPVERGVHGSKVKLVVDFGNGHTKIGKDLYDQKSKIFSETKFRIYRDLYYIYKDK